MRRAFLASEIVLMFMLFASLPVANAQSDLRTRNPVGLFQDMQVDTVTSDLFNHFAPTPHMNFHVTVPVPGQDLIGASSGCAVIDFNHDGYPDVLMSRGDFEGEGPSVLLLGNGDGTFTVARNTGLPAGMGSPVVADLDGDGWEDLVVRVYRGVVRVQERDKLDMGDWAEGEYLAIFRNHEGRQFQEMTTSWLPRGLAFPSSFCLSDLDQDGHLDLIFSRHSESGPGEIAIFQGTRDGFSEGERIALPENWKNPGHHFGAAILVFDLDDDGCQDVLIQETGFFPRIPRKLLVAFNRQGTLQPWQEAPLAQVGRVSAVSWVDVDNDGSFDAYAGISDFDGGRNQLYLNRGDGRFEDRGKQMGLWAGYNHCSGGCWADLDNDGYQDFLQGRHFAESAYTDPALYLNEQGKRFVNITARADKPLGPGMSQAVAVDADQDGDLDLLYGHLSFYEKSTPLAATGLKLLRNDSMTGNWLKVKLVGTRSNRSAVGGRARIFFHGQSQIQQVANGIFQEANQPSLVMHFGLGSAAAVDSVVVRWPDGRTEWWPRHAAGQTIVLTEGEGQSRSGK